MDVSGENWGNKVGTTERDCSCGSWMNHWVKMTGKAWPMTCSVEGCDEKATLGAHVYHANVEGERIVPMCAGCNKKGEKFNLKGGTSVPSARRDECAR